MIQTATENDELHGKLPLKSRAILEKELGQASEKLALLNDDAERLNEEAVAGSTENEFLDRVVVYENK